MLAFEARCFRALVIRLEPGDELCASLTAALEEAGVKAASIEGTGTLQSVDLLIVDQARHVEAASELVTLAGAYREGRPDERLRLTATVARETETGLQLLAGRLFRAVVEAAEVHVTIFDEAPTSPAAIEIPKARGSAPTASITEILTAPIPAPLPRVVEELETYPEAGDSVTHFQLGECQVVTSDGDRIRLRQEKGGPVREYSLSVLRVQPPTTDPETGHRHFNLLRKN